MRNNLPPVKARLGWIDQARGFAIVLVILFHSNTLLRFGYEPIPALTTLFAVFAPVRMPLLVFLSGFIAYFSLKKSPQVFFSGKLRSLLWPYLVWTGVYYFGVGAHHSVFDYSLYLSYLWFLGYLFIYYAIAWLCRRISHIPTILTAFLLSAVIPADSNTLRRFFFLLGIFLAGVIAHQMIEEFAALLRRKELFILVIPIAVTAVFSWRGEHVHYNPVFLAAAIAGVLLACGIFCRVAERFDNLLTRSLEYFGRNSVVFYVTHFQVIYFTIILSSKAGIGNAWIVYFVAVLVSLMVGQLFCLLRSKSIVAATLFEWPKRSDMSFNGAGSRRRLPDDPPRLRYTRARRSVEHMDGRGLG